MACCVALLLLFAPVVLVIVSPAPNRVWIVVASYVVFYATHARLCTWRCPRCGKWFCAGWGVTNPFARRCVHCDMPAFQSPENYSPHSSYISRPRD